MADWSAVRTGGQHAAWHTDRASGRRKKRAAAMSELDKHPQEALAESGTGTKTSASTVAMPTVGVATPLEPNVVLPGNQPTEEVHSSTNKPTASGQD